MAARGPLRLDVVIFGGGGAGLWLLDELARRGHQTLLLEAHELGGGQTVNSQGIIHGGFKYSLDGLLSASARATRAMPDLWRRCLAGAAPCGAGAGGGRGGGGPDLSRTHMRAQHCHIWRTATLKSRLALLAARAGLQTPVTRLDRDARPAILAGCPEPVVRLDEPVIDPPGFVADLADRHRDRIVKIDAEEGLAFDAGTPGTLEGVRLQMPQAGEPLELRPRKVVLTAGAGNAGLREQLGLPAGVMQRRPLHMTVARGKLDDLNGHCIDGARTRVTITSTKDEAGTTVWQIGGQIAEDGVEMEPAALIEHARAELVKVLPGFDPAGTEWFTYRIDRAEASMSGGFRPSDVHCLEEGDVITAWPTKLALVPRLAYEVAERIGPPAETEPIDMTGLEGLPRPQVAKPIWERCQSWSTAS